MFHRLLIAVDQRESRRSLIGFARRVAEETGSTARVLHVIEFAGRGCAAPLSTSAEASLLVEETVFELRMAGIGASGLHRSALRRTVGSMIVDEAGRWEADTILLGGRHHRGAGRLLGHQVREHVLRLSPLPVLVAPDRHPTHRSPVSSLLER